MDWLRRNWVYLLCVATLPAGLALFVHGLSYSVYTDHSLASELKMAVYDSDEGRSLSQLGDAVRALRTPRHAFMQGGISLAITGMAIAGLFAVFGRGTARGLETPGDRKTFVPLGLGAMCVFWIAEYASYELDIRRGDVLIGGGPTFLASIIGMLVMTPISALIVWLVGKAICSRFGELPVPLAFWDKDQPLRSWLVTLSFAFPAALCATMLVTYFATSGFLATPGLIVWLYVIMASRAAWLAGPIKTAKDGGALPSSSAEREM